MTVFGVHNCCRKDSIPLWVTEKCRADRISVDRQLLAPGENVHFLQSFSILQRNFSPYDTRHNTTDMSFRGAPRGRGGGSGFGNRGGFAPRGGMHPLLSVNVLCES